jgi:type VI secretion system protein ImpG
MAAPLFVCASNALKKVDWSKAEIDKVAIFLNAESPISSALHLAMTRRVHAMYARHAGTYTERHQFDGWCKPMGFDDNDGLWKKADTAFSGYQLLLEYFSFRRNLCLLSYAASTHRAH